MTGRGRWSRLRADGDRGSAIIEFIGVGILVMVPLIYLLVAVAAVQRDQAAVANAARNAGRAFVDADDVPTGMRRAQVAARLAFADAGLHDDPRLRFVLPGAGCASPAIAPSLTPGAEFTVCVTRSTRMPGVPTLLAGRGVTSEARFVVHIDDYRSDQPS